MHMLALTMVITTLLVAACGDKPGHAIQGDINTDNVGFLLTPSEIEQHGRNGLDIDADIIGLIDRARDTGADVDDLDDWVGIDYAESVDGARLNLALMDLIDSPSAHARFDDLRQEFMLVESEQEIGERFAGLAPITGGVHTITMFLVGDKVTVMTTTTSLTDRQPLMTSEELVELTRLVASRIAP